MAKWRSMEVAERRRHCDVVSYLSKELTAKISIEGDEAVSVLRQGTFIFSPLGGGGF